MKTKKRNLHNELMKIAETEAKCHIEEEDGERCFNLFTFLEALPNRIESERDRLGFDNFEIDSVAVARYLWCCMAIKDESSPSGNEYAGMPILD